MNNDDIPGAAADNDNDKDASPRQAPGAVEAPREPVGSVVSLQRARLRLDKRSAELEAMLDEAGKLARTRLALAAREPEPEVEDVYIKQWVALAGCYAKLLTTGHKHHAFLDGDS